MRILVAEDDKDTAEFIHRGLSELGHNPVIADNGVDALHMISTGVPEMPEGKAVDEIPSRPVRAPVPPALNQRMLNRWSSTWNP